MTVTSRYTHRCAQTGGGKHTNKRVCEWIEVKYEKKNKYLFQTVGKELLGYSKVCSNMVSLNPNHLTCFSL